MQALDILGTLGLPEPLIEQVRGMLATQAQSLEGGNIDPIDGSIFGGSDAAANLGHHASLAQKHVAEAVLQMADGLRGFRDNLGVYVDDLGGRDVDSGVSLAAIHESTECVAKPNFQTNSSCAAPSAGSEG